MRKAPGADRHRLCPSPRQGECCGFAFRQMNGFYCLTNTQENASQREFGRRSDTCQLWFITGGKQPALRRRMTRARCCAGLFSEECVATEDQANTWGCSITGTSSATRKVLEGLHARYSQARAWSRGKHKSVGFGNNRSVTAASPRSGARPRNGAGERGPQAAVPAPHQRAAWPRRNGAGSVFQVPACCRTRAQRGARP